MLALVGLLATPLVVFMGGWNTSSERPSSGKVVAGDPITKPSTAKGQAWTRHQLDRLSFEFPYKFVRGIDVLQELPLNIQNSIKSLSTYSSVDSEKYRVDISQLVYNDDIAVDLRGAMEGGMTGGLRKIPSGSTSSLPNYSIEELQVKGRSALYSSCEFEAFGETVCLEMLIIVEDQTIWQFSILYTFGVDIPDSTRVFESIAIDPKS
jgi:hypothetical protein